MIGRISLSGKAVILMRSRLQPGEAGTENSKTVSTVSLAAMTRNR